MVILRSSSSGRQSAAIVPLATRPCVFTALEMNSAASIREVLPLEACPTTATVRIFEVSTGIGESPENWFTCKTPSNSLDARLIEIVPEGRANQAKSLDGGGILL